MKKKNHYWKFTFPIKRKKVNRGNKEQQNYRKFSKLSKESNTITQKIILQNMKFIYKRLVAVNIIKNVIEKLKIDDE